MSAIHFFIIARPLPVIPPINRRPVQGILARFFRNGEAHDLGIKVAINELEIKSWEACLNYLNKQPKLTLPSGGIKYVYALNGHEIRSLNKLQHRQSYVVASGIFLRTKFQHANDAFNDDPDTTTNLSNQPSNSTVRSTASKRWRTSPTTGEQLFILPYSRLNLYESILLNRNVTTTFDQWLNEEVTDLLSQYLTDGVITHLYAITRTAFIEVRTNKRFCFYLDEKFF
jgi:hypothetical protein